MTAILIAGAAAAAADAAAESAADSAVDALARELAGRGWIVFAGHPKEIDGGQIIDEPQRRGQLDLYLSRPDGSQLRNMTNTEQYTEFGGRFLPDGKRVLYRRLPPAASINHDLWGEMGELVVAEADGSNPVVQGEAGEFPWASFSPDMSRIACLYRKQRTIRIFDFATKRLLTEMPAQGIYQQLFWSPDGRRLVGTANVTGRRWNVASISLRTQSLTVLTRALNCTPDWFQADPRRVIYSNRNPALFPGKYNNYGLTMLMWASVDGKTRRLIYGDAWKHCYFGCTSPDDKYIIFSDDVHDTIVVGQMHVIRLADTPIIPEGIKQIRLLHPDYKEGPVLDLKLKTGIPLRGFEPHWTYANVLDRTGTSP